MLLSGLILADALRRVFDHAALLDGQFWIRNRCHALSGKFYGRLRSRFFHHFADGFPELLNPSSKAAGRWGSTAFAYFAFEFLQVFSSTGSSILFRDDEAVFQQPRVVKAQFVVQVLINHPRAGGRRFPPCRVEGRALCNVRRAAGTRGQARRSCARPR